MNPTDKNEPDPFLAGLLAELPDEVQPSRDLWEGIDAALDGVPLPHQQSEIAEPLAVAEPAPSAWPKVTWLLAALVPLAIGYGMGRAVPTAPEPEPIAQARPAPEPSAWQSEQLAHTDELLASVRARKDLTPETATEIEKNLLVIEQAIEAVRSALDDEPGDNELMKHLAGIYDQRIRLLETANRLPAGS